MTSTPELRAAGLLLGRMGASILQMADAIDSGDEEVQRRIATDILKLMGGIIQVISGIDQATAEVLGGSVRDFAGEFSGAHESAGAPASGTTLTPKDIAELLKERST